MKDTCTGSFLPEHAMPSSILAAVPNQPLKTTALPWKNVTEREETTFFVT